MALDDDSMELDLLAASLRADMADMKAFTEALADKLEAALPGSVTVSRVRQGFRGPKVVREITIDAGGERLTLQRDGDRTETLRAHVSGGITLKSERLTINDWIQKLTELLAVQARQGEITRQALEQLLLNQ